MSKNNDRIKNYALVITTSIVLLGAFYKTYGHFAKTKTVEAISKTVMWVEERLAIGTHDARVDRQKGAVDMARDRLRFEAKTGNPTPAEEDNVKIQEERLQDVIKERDEIVAEYKSKK